VIELAKKNINENVENTNEEVVEEISGEVVEETEETETIEKEKYDELYDKHLRLMAEYDNFKKRTQKEKEELGTFAVSATIEKLLPVIDNFERALDSVSAEEKNTFSEGVEMVYRQMMEILDKMGVSEIEAVGCEFNPEIHNAVMHVDDDAQDANVVVEQFMKGYKYKDKVIRYSMVKVAN
jgi:molecular chaperone GrpE